MAHFVLFPFMAQGHLLPFVALGRLLEEKRSGHTITVVNTPLNILSLQSILPPESTVRLVSLPFNGPDHGLPPNRESTDTLTYPLIIRLLEATKTLKPTFDLLISTIIREEDGRKPICIISDFFFGWTVEIAHAHGIFHSLFMTSGAYGSAIDFTMWIHLPHSKTDSDEFQLPGFPETLRVHRSQMPSHLSVADGSDSWSRFLAPEMALSLRSDGLLFNTVEELEKTGLKFFSMMTNGRPLWPIGPISSQKQKKMGSGISVDACVSWLNLHRPDSVLFVSFGSQNTISATQMMELATGLEESGRAFIWVIRPPLGNDINGEFRDEWLPDGFEERVAERKRGLLVRKWAPQVEILSHESTGAFISHCGWNSILESLSKGVPLMGWPIAAEQFFNSKMLEEELGVSVEIVRGNSSEINKGRVKEVIQMVMGETEKRERMRRKALEVKKMMEDAVREEEGFKGSSLKAMDAFIHTVISARRTPTKTGG